MNDLDERVRRAFDAAAAPEDVKRETLSYIASFRNASGAPSAPGAEAELPLPGAASEARRRVPRVRIVRRAFAALAACAVLVAVGLGGLGWYKQPTAYVGIDVNPSIELGLNRFGVVVAADGLNDDGRALLDAVPLLDRSYDEALSQLVKSDAFAPYAREDAFVEISVTSSDSRQAEELRAQSDAHLASLPCRGSCHAVDEETREAAVSAGMGAGRYRAALELMALDPNATLEECASMTMSELRDCIAACSDGADGEGGEAPGTGSAAGGGSQGRGHGHGAHDGTGRHAAG